ncbi:aspartate/glutamate racemase family protein [Leucobacter soli]|uniref:L-aspartate/glutamate-specific racemase n=1 Tax=Leucobacter soli TaxID=2812850 RepID=A0A916JX30_9MICO|nr:aspartate/glutamate racemase family protein [Leucobacter soli]CAG7610861.1 L-aspartate/glutamate-specific racemase [Leucobacter soli]
MRTIGLIGGMSWESTAVYYREANELVRNRLGGLNSARIALASLNFQEISELQQAAKWDEAGERLADAARWLEAGGADMILICTNTMHLLVDRVQAAVSVPVLHIGDVAAEAVRERGLEKVALLGTSFTMEKAFYRDRIAGHGIEVVVPGAADREAIHGAIFGELAMGVVSDATRETFRGIIRRLVDDGAEGIILGCTEIELLVSQADSPVPVFPTAKLHIEAAVDRALA